MKTLVLLVLALVAAVYALNNGVCTTPPMGWNSWNQFKCNINETLIIETMDAIIANGLNKLGYEYVILDDCWAELERDTDGNLVADKKRFPRGIKFLSDYAHKKGLKLGIYSDVGEKTCEKYPGSYGHYEQDAKLFAQWGVDYLKLDYCNLVEGQSEEPWKYYGQMSTALNQTGRPICFSICNWGFKDPWKWAPQISNLWRTTLDIFPYWPWVMYILDAQNKLADYAGPGAYNDADMLEVGVNSTIGNLPGTPETRLTPNECISHFSMWAMLSTPFILGNDLRKMPSWVFNIITNSEVIAVNQDPLVKQGKIVKDYKSGVIAEICPVAHCVHTQVWAKQLSGNKLAVVLFNRGGPIDEQSVFYGPEKVTVTWKDLNITAGESVQVRDLWQHKDLGTYQDSFTTPVELAQHAVQMLLFTFA